MKKTQKAARTSIALEEATQNPPQKKRKQSKGQQPFTESNKTVFSAMNGKQLPQNA